MYLESGHNLKSEINKMDITVIKKLGEGAQGVVYLVENAGRKYALKWYNLEQSTSFQKTAILKLVQNGPPKNIAGKRFIWPIDLVMGKNNEQFGYLMQLIDMSRFSTLGQVQAHQKHAPGFSALCKISYQVANSYRALHLAGYCYRDISAGNVVFDPKTGDVLICDNDNVGIDKESKSQVRGTMEFMAPEVVTGKSDPSALTDLHSLAVLLFNMWIWHHPLEGMLEYQIRSWDLPAKVKIYGSNPVFVFDPNDKTNFLPNDPEYLTAKKRWSYCPNALKEMFITAFTIGLKDPNRRVQEGQWQSLFMQLQDCVTVCPKCHAENIWEPTNTELICWYCKNNIQVPVKAIFTHKYGKNYLILNIDIDIFKRHLNPTSDGDGNSIVGKVVQNPNKPDQWGIRNLTQTTWFATKVDGSTIEIPPQKAVPLLQGIKVKIEDSTLEFIS